MQAMLFHSIHEPDSYHAKMKHYAKSASESSNSSLAEPFAAGYLVEILEDVVVVGGETEVFLLMSVLKYDCLYFST